MMPGEDNRLLIQALERIAALRANVDTLSQAVVGYHSDLKAHLSAAAEREEAILAHVREQNGTLAEHSREIGKLKRDVAPLKAAAQNARAVRTWLSSRWRLALAIAAGLAAMTSGSLGLLALAKRLGA